MNDSAEDQYIPGLGEGGEGVETFAFATHRQREWYSVQAGFWRSLWLVLCGGRLREWKHLPVGSVPNLMDDEEPVTPRSDFGI